MDASPLQLLKIAASGTIATEISLHRRFDGTQVSCFKKKKKAMCKCPIFRCFFPLVGGGVRWVTYGFQLSSSCTNTLIN